MEQISNTEFVDMRLAHACLATDDSRDNTRIYTANMCQFIDHLQPYEENYVKRDHFHITRSYACRSGEVRDTELLRRFQNNAPQALILL